MSRCRLRRFHSHATSTTLAAKQRQATEQSIIGSHPIQPVDPNSTSFSSAAGGTKISIGPLSVSVE